MAVSVARFDELEEAVPRIVEVNGREMVLVRVRGEVHAVRNLCPHMSCSFEGGPVVDLVVGSIDQIVFEHDDPVIICPWHQFEFSLRRGECVTNSTMRMATYEVTVEDGEVLVSSTPRRRADAAGG